ncbi:MAG: hypothetical protein RLZ12_108 [Bacillota bacterium]|jgi:segregation and condensation protein A
MDVKIDSFTGPLDLLLYLVEQKKLDVCEVSLAEVADQFLAIIKQIDPQNLGVVSSYLVVAAKLIVLKSRAILAELCTNLSSTETEKYKVTIASLHIAEELLQQLLRFRAYKKLGDILSTHVKKRQQLYTRKPLALKNPDEDFNSLTVQKLKQILAQLNQKDIVSSSNLLQKVFSNTKVSLEEKMLYILKMLQKGSTILFSQLIACNPGDRKQIVGTFIAMLELAKEKKISIEQQHLFTDILMQEL